MEIKTEDYQVSYDEGAQVIRCAGSFRLNGSEEYAPIIAIFDAAAVAGHTALTLDLRELKFLNSFGINILSKFVIAVRQKGQGTLRVLGSKAIPWQGKSLVNLQRLMPRLELVIE